MNSETQREALLQTRYAKEKVEKVESTLKGTIYNFHEIEFINQIDSAIQALKEVKKIIKGGGEKDESERGHVEQNEDI